MSAKQHSARNLPPHAFHRTLQSRLVALRTAARRWPVRPPLAEREVTAQHGKAGIADPWPERGGAVTGSPPRRRASVSVRRAAGFRREIEQASDRSSVQRYLLKWLDFGLAHRSPASLKIESKSARHSAWSGWKNIVSGDVPIDDFNRN